MEVYKINRRTSTGDVSPATSTRKSAWFVRAFSDTTLDVSVIKLSDRAFRVLLTLDARAATEPFCFPGNRWLREKTGKSDSTLAEIFAELEGGGWMRRVFTESQKRERIGFVFLRRIDPETSPSAEDTPQGIDRAKAEMLAKIASLDSGNPESRPNVSPGIRSQRLRKSGDNVSGNPDTPDSGNPAPYKESVVVVRTTETDSSIQSGGADSASLSSNDNENDPEPEPSQSRPDAEIEARVELKPPGVVAADELASIGATLDRAMVDIKQVASMADEPINAGLTDGQRRFLDAIGDERKAKLRAMSPGKRREILTRHSDGFNPTLVSLQVGEIDRSQSVAPPPRPIVTMEDLVGAVAGGDTGQMATLAEQLVRDFGGEVDRQRWGAVYAMCQQLWRGEVDPDAVLDAHRQAMGPKAKNPGAVFTTALKAHGWKP